MSDEAPIGAKAGKPAGGARAHGQLGASSPLATLRERLIAALIDLGAFWLSLTVSFLGMWQFLVPAPTPGPFRVLGSLVGGLALLVCPALVVWQALRIMSSGQSLGKRRMGIRVELADGSPAGFYHGVLLRSWSMALLTLAPWGELVVIAGYALIFRETRRCLHDEIAKTRVVANARGPASTRRTTEGRG